MSDQSLNQFAPVMEELGINPDSLDASDLEYGTEEVTEEVASEESTEEEVEAEESEDGEEIESESVDESAPEGEEKAASEESTETEEVAEEKTAKENQEVETLKAEYEAKMQAFEQEKQKFETEFVAKNAEKLKVHDEFDSFLGNIADADPELFSILQDEFAKFQKANHDPRIAELKQKQAETDKKLQEVTQLFSDKSTLVAYDAEMKELKATLGKEAEAVGLKVDYSKVESVWADNKSLGLKAAFYAVNGEAMKQAAVSKAKVAQATKKVAARPSVSTVGTVQRGNSRPSEVVPSDAFDAVRHFAKQFTKNK